MARGSVPTRRRAVLVARARARVTRAAFSAPARPSAAREDLRKSWMDYSARRSSMRRSSISPERRRRHGAPRGSRASFRASLLRAHRASSFRVARAGAVCGARLRRRARGIGGRQRGARPGAASGILDPVRRRVVRSARGARARDATPAVGVALHRGVGGPSRCARNSSPTRSA